MKAQILVMDFGSQLCHLIARRVRCLGVYAEVIPCDASAEELKRNKRLKGLILSGGPDSVFEEGSPQCDKGIFDLGIPVLGICYGHHLIAQYLDGRVISGTKKEFGLTNFMPKESRLFNGLKEKEIVWMNHGDTVSELPPGFHVIGSTENCPIAAFEDTEKNIFAVQFHPEVTHTVKGGRIIKNFVKNICKARKDHDVAQMVPTIIGKIKEQIGDRKAVIGLSGGIDSTTAAALVDRAIGKNLTAIFVDTGYMRKDEPELVKKTFSSWPITLNIVDARERFYSALSGARDPEVKRKTIGKLFIDVFEEEAKKTGAEVLVQGTIYPDRIESGITKHASTIKSHHNVGGLPEKLNVELCEPLDWLYKDEVRAIAHELGLPKELIGRHPFPGPGIAIRIIGEPTRDRARIVQEATAIMEEELARSGYYDKASQALCVFLPSKTVGVQGDARAYKDIIAVRIVTTTDFMTASFSNVPHDILERISTRITNEIREIGRVVYDITNKPPGTIEWE